MIDGRKLGPGERVSGAPGPGEHADGDDVQGHVIVVSPPPVADDRDVADQEARQGRSTPAPQARTQEVLGMGTYKATDDPDVEGHGLSRPKATDDDDVEGHGSRRPQAADDDDVEGHGSRRPV
jgi:hypothetical protein